ncbi:hypothetical protein SAMN05444349_11184 [Bacteroides faecichinchillae]|uniref:SGNH domain-containing protein n=1 Tax=Bacteroides faecichinchillae TaxID=871325 RepID=A0A1M4YXW1_9BACE|nr:hypothetical protein [Bacteroides faecichinchillae]SHF10545.1 hypothetical protein SAMN05444349_11184 [Bacteroides faecichinchillae]
MQNEIYQNTSNNTCWLNQLKGKEVTEWSNFWYDHANEKVNERILLVDDSIARQIRRSLSETLERPCDLFASSAALRDAMYWDQWECFFKNGLYKYDVIFVWIGNHSRISEDGQSFFTDYDYSRFRKDFTFLLCQCMLRSSKVFVLSTLHMYKTRKYNPYIERVRRKLCIKPKEILIDIENRIVEGKNFIMREIASEKGVCFYDIDKQLMNSKFWHTDFIHYIPESNKFVCELLRGLLQ